MTSADALHTVARRYCQDRNAYWRQRYAELAQPDFGARGDYLDEHKNVFPRYNVLEAILVEVERLRPEDVQDLATMRNRLWSIGQGAEGQCTERRHRPIEQRAMQEERDLFSSFTADVDAETLEDVAPLPYRRTLLEEESNALWERLKQRFGLGEHHYWYPLQGDRPPNTTAFEANAFHEQVPAATLRSILTQAGVTRLWEFREYGPEYEIDVAILDPIDNGAEGYWTAGDMDWLIYASHESTITVSGGWLLRAIEALWPTAASHRIDW